MEENQSNKPDPIKPDKRLKKEFDILKEHFKSEERKIKAEREGKIIPEFYPVVYGFSIIMRNFHRQFEKSANGLVDIEKPFKKPLVLDIFNEEGNVEKIEVDNLKKGFEIYIEQMEKFRFKISEQDKKEVDNLLITAKTYLSGQ